MTTPLGHFDSFPTTTRRRAGAKVVGGIPKSGSAVLLVAFAGAVVVRAALAGPAGARSVGAGLAFAILLAALAVACQAKPHLSWRIAGIGVGVGVILVAPAALHMGVRASLPASGFPVWALLTAVVAGAEEAFLRGALFDAVQRRHSADAAVVVAAIAFAALHVPLYGWHVVPLDFAVGLVLGATRLVAGTWTAPAIAHVGADLGGWWLL
jgi:membrane protease YdiL (CAAX protease family)